MRQLKDLRVRVHYAQMMQEESVIYYLSSIIKRSIIDIQ